MGKVYDKTAPGYTISTLYHNMTSNKPNGLLLANQLLSVSKPMPMHELTEKGQGKQYLNSTPRGVCDGLKHYLQEQFAKPCRFEG